MSVLLSGPLAVRDQLTNNLRQSRRSLFPILFRLATVPWALLPFSKSQGSLRGHFGKSLFPGPPFLSSGATQVQ